MSFALPHSVQSFVEAKPWARRLCAIHQAAHRQISEAVDPLQLQPTRHSPDGVLHVSPASKSSDYVMATFRGSNGAVEHCVSTVGCVPAFGSVQFSIFAQANLSKGTPMLNLELGGNEQCMLVAAVMNPTLSSIRHKWYRDKYYRTGRGGAASLTQLHERMAARVPAGPGQGVVLRIGVGPPPAASPGAEGSPAKYYQVLHSHQLWTRLIAGHGVLFCFDPTDEQALAAVEEDVRAAMGMWCAHAADDAAHGEALMGELLAECRDTASVMANFLDHDEASAGAEAIFGPELTAVMKETMNGTASLAGAPWWAQ